MHWTMPLMCVNNAPQLHQGNLMDASPHCPETTLKNTADIRNDAHPGSAAQAGCISNHPEHQKHMLPSQAL